MNSSVSVPTTVAENYRLRGANAELLCALELLVGEETEESAVMSRRDKERIALAALVKAKEVSMSKPTQMNETYLTRAVFELQNECDRLREANAELLKVLKDIVRDVEEGEAMYWHHDDITAASAAIEKHTQQSTNELHP